MTTASQQAVKKTSCPCSGGLIVEPINAALNIIIEIIIIILLKNVLKKMIFFFLNLFTVWISLIYITFTVSKNYFN